MVTAYHAGDSGEPDAGALEVLVAVEPLKSHKEFAGVLLVKACAVVADKEGAVLRGPAEMDVRVGSFAGELGGVAEDVLKDDAKETGIALSAEAGLDAEVKSAVGEAVGDIVRND